MLDSMSTEKKGKATKYTKDNRTTHNFNSKETFNHVGGIYSQLSIKGIKKYVSINKTLEDEKASCGCELAITAADLSLVLGA